MAARTSWCCSWASVLGPARGLFVWFLNYLRILGLSSLGWTGLDLDFAVLCILAPELVIDYLHA